MSWRRLYVFRSLLFISNHSFFVIFLFATVHCLCRMSTVWKHDYTFECSTHSSSIHRSASSFTHQIVRMHACVTMPLTPSPVIHQDPHFAYLLPANRTRFLPDRIRNLISPDQVPETFSRNVDYLRNVVSALEEANGWWLDMENRGGSGKEGVAEAEMREGKTVRRNSVSNVQCFSQTFRLGTPRNVESKLCSWLFRRCLSKWCGIKQSRGVGW